MNLEQAGWVFAASMVMFVAGLLLMPWVVTRIPADYFLRDEPALSRWRSKHPFFRYILLPLKNLVGLVLLFAGIAMLALPGQGILTILVATMLLDFPGKRALEIRLVRFRGVLRTINWIRARSGHPPLLLPPAKRHRRNRKNPRP